MSNNNESSRSGEGTIITTAVAIDRDKNSQYAVRWAVENLLKSKNASIFLLHVRTTQNSLAQDLVPKEGRAPTESELQQFFLPYRGFCARKGVRAKEVVLQDIDIPKIMDGLWISQNNPTNSPVERKTIAAFKNPDVPTSLGRFAPDFCSVYAISKGKVQNVRSASRLPSSRQASHSGYSSDTPSSEDFNRTFSQGSWRSQGSEGLSFDRSSARSNEKVSFDKSSDYTPIVPPDRLPGNKSPLLLQSANNNLRIHTKGSPSLDSASDASDFSGPHSFQSAEMSYENLDQPRTSDGSRSSLSSQSLQELEDEMRRLKLELKQTMEMYNSACKEALNAKQKAREIDQWKSAEARKLEEAKQAEEAALAMVEMEKQKCKAAMEAAQMAQRLADLESQKRKNAETKAKHEAEEKKKAMDALARTNNIRYRKYSIEEIEVATNYFATSAKIGEGGYGPVYKAFLDHTAVAIKVLRPDISQGQKQFQREVEVLSCMRHPNMVLLVGACPEYGCLVYEHMENGSLEDRLFRRHNTPPIPWRTRFKIAAEIATALLFLHQAKPEPLVHRDLKPANILLDRNFVSKISDVGLARLVPPSMADSVTQYHMTAAAGTFCYIDPEYQQTGMLGTKSDIYSLGVLFLQVITAKPPMGLTHQVLRSIDKGTFSEMLDQSITDWPVEEALSFAKMALQCCELRRKDRPDLSTVILPELIRLRDLGLGNGPNYGHHGRNPNNPSFEEPRRSNSEMQVEIQRRSGVEESSSSNSNSTLENLIEG
ncbi:hypothetical protein LguiB_008454 [Lonicera macranthoides]